MQLRDEPAGNHQRGRLVFDEVGHHLHHRIFHFVRQGEGLVPGNGRLRIPLRTHRLLVQPRRILGPDFDLLVQWECECGRSRLHHGSARRQAPVPRRPLHNRTLFRWFGRPGALGPRPAIRLRAPSANARGARLGIPCEGMTLRPAPAPQMNRQFRRAACHRHLFSLCLPERAPHQQMPSLVETQVVQIYPHCAATARTKPSIDPKRRKAPASAAYPLVRPGSHFLSPSISSSGRTSASA